MEARVLVSLLSSKDITLGLAAMDMVLEMTSLGPKELVEAMAANEGLVARLTELQRRIKSGDFGVEAAMKQSLAWELHGEVGSERGGRRGSGEKRERRVIRSEIRRLVGERFVSEEEFVTIVAEVL